VKNVAQRVKGVVKGGHKVVSVRRGQEGACVRVRNHPLSQFCHEWVIIQCHDCLLSCVILGREVKVVALLSIKSRNFVNEGHGIASVRGQEGVSSVVGIVSLLWPCVGVLCCCC
jgi:hypothetical protein